MVEDNEKAVSKDGYHHQVEQVKKERRSTQDITVRTLK